MSHVMCYCKLILEVWVEHHSLLMLKATDQVVVLDKLGVRTSLSMQTWGRIDKNIARIIISWRAYI